MIAGARHILVSSRQEADKILFRLKKGEDFAKLAKQFSTCPSKKQGGDLGEVKQKQMVGPIDKAIFKGKELALQGPIKSQFGFHILQVIYRQ